MQTGRQALRTTLRVRIAEHTAPLMFALAFAFLICQAVLVVVWVDVPNFRENAALALGSASEEAARIRQLISDGASGGWIQDAAIYLMLMIWPIVIAESVFHWFSRPWDAATRRYHFFGLLFCVCPSLRMCARCPEIRHRLWLPTLGWRLPNKRLRKRLERRFSLPMIAIALLIMPVLIIEFFMKAQVAQYGWLRLSLHISTGVIWFAFAAEFILMVSVADKKIAYCKDHWIDLAIILLPLFSFLRSLRVLRATRAVRSLRVSQITKLARVYRLRGTAVKALRALVLLDFIQRMLTSNVDRSIEKLQRQLEDIEEEAKEIRRQIARLRRRRREQDLVKKMSEQPEITVATDEDHCP